MDKLKMAHDYLLKIIPESPLVDESDICFFVDTVWKYADAMQAESEKREDKTRPEVLTEEWQPDWSQAPDDKITHWTMEKDKRYSWWIGEPKKDSQNHYESIENANCSFYGDAPSFNYQGNWKESLRKRPQ